MGVPTPTFSIDLEQLDQGGVMVRVTGELDLSTSPQLREVLGRELDRGKSVALDLSQVTFIDSTALNALVGALRSCETNGGSFVVAPDLPAQVSRVFAITGLDAILPIGARS